ncbi:MAG: hypothetical protein L6265_09115 [Thermoplasmatales archaeon]|nr:hypothetical protein [Thermoplasmatales archaeon]
MVRFNYRKQKSKAFGTVYRPMGEILLIYERKVKETFYIDSGADVTLIPRSVGELLGLKIKDDDKIIDLYGIGDAAISAVIKGIKIKIGEHEIPVRIGWALTEKIPLILGRMDIFNRFKILFDEKKKEIMFEWIEKRR